MGVSQGCLAELALAGLLAYAATDSSAQMSHTASIAAIVLVSPLEYVLTGNAEYLKTLCCCSSDSQ